MVDPKIRKLAKLTISENKVNREVAQFAIKHLTRKGLLTYLSYLKIYAEKNIARVTTEKELSPVLKKRILEIFDPRTVYFEKDKIGDGIRIQVSDTIIDLSLTNLIDTTVEKLKN